MTARKALHSSKSNEWYTPPEVVEPVRDFLGEIELDPASCELANLIVKATRYYTEKEDGLIQPWDGKFFSNPPYGTGTALWPARACEQFLDRIAPEGIMLLNATPDRKWFRPLWQHPILFMDKRVCFLETYEQWKNRWIEGYVRKNRAMPSLSDLPLTETIETYADGRLVRGPSPTHGNVLVYFGDREEEFRDAFSKFGHVTMPG